MRKDNKVKNEVEGEGKGEKEKVKPQQQIDENPSQMFTNRLLCIVFST